MDAFIKNIQKEISGSQREDVITMYASAIGQNIKQFLQFDLLYNLPFNVLLSIFKIADFEEEDAPKIVEIVRKSVKAHMDDNNLLSLLQVLKTSNVNFNLQQCIEIFSSFQFCDICKQVAVLYEEEVSESYTKELESQIQKKDKEIQRLNSIIEELHSEGTDRSDEIIETLSMRENKRQNDQQPKKQQQNKQQKKQQQNKQNKKQSSVSLMFPKHLIRPQPHDFVPNIFNAIKQGNLTSVRYLVELDHSKMSIPNREKYYTINIACMEEQTKIVQYFAENECNINQQDPSGKTPLYVACEKGNLEIVKILIQNKASMTTNNYSQTTPLMVAIQNNNFPIVKCLVEDGNAPLSDNSALLAAIKAKNLQITQYLIETGGASPENNRPLECAFQNSTYEIVKYLITQVLVSVDWNSGMTPLHYACKLNYSDIVHYLIEQQNVFVDDTDNHKKTPLFYVLENKNEELAKYFIEQLDVKVDIYDDYGTTPLHLACQMGSLPIVKYLLETKKVPMRENKSRQTPLFYAFNSEPLVEYLIEHGANVNSSSNNIYPIQMAYSRGYRKIVELIILKRNFCYSDAFCIACDMGLFEAAQHILKQNPSYCNSSMNGYYALYYALKNGNQDIIKLLLETPNINVESIGQTSALHYACELGNLEAVKYLIEVKRVNTNNRDRENRTPYGVADKYNRTVIVNYLRSKGINQ